MGWTPLNSVCGVRQFASSDVVQRSQKSDTLNFNHLASPWEIECPCICSHVQIQARDHRDQLRPWGLLLLSYTLLLCPLHYTCSFIKAFVVYPGMEHAEVLLVGRQ